MSDPSVGQVGGVFAGVVALAVAVGHGLRWWLGWTDRRAASRAAKLDAWQRELMLREARLDAEQAAIIAEIKAQLAELRASNDQLRTEHAALLGAFQLVAGGLRAENPHNPALGLADEILKAAFPIEPRLPASIADAAAKLNDVD
jgi:uncharacterized protein HemX